MALLPPATIATRLAERLELPGAGARDLPARQQSMERAVAWSYDLLDPPAQRLLARLSVFLGGCRLEEAEVVCGPAADLGVDALAGLSALVEHSLVQPVPGPDGHRFRLLETIQTFASRRLAESGEAQEVTRRHARAYRDLAEAAAVHLPGGGQLPWLRRLAAERDNLRGAVDWAVSNAEAEDALRLGVALWRFWQLTGHVEEGLANMARILDVPGVDAPTALRMRALAADGGLRYWGADLPGADVRYRQQLELARALGDPAGIADALYNRMHTAFLLDSDEAAAEAYTTEAAALYRELGDEQSLGRLEWNGLNRALARGETDVDDRLMAALRRFEQFGDDWYAALTRGTLAWSALARGDALGALRWWLESLDAHREMGDIATVTIGLRANAIVYDAAGRRSEAITLQAAFEALCKRHGVQPPAFFEELTPLGEVQAFDLDVDPEAAALGAAMSFDEAVDFATEVGREILAQAE
jgi:hypothetical protein